MTVSPLAKYRRDVKSTPGHDHNAKPIPASLALALPDGVTVSSTALVCPQQLTIDEWRSLGRTLRQLEESIQWWLGDWWHYGFHRYGERKTAVTAKTFARGKAFGTLMNYGWVAGKVETSRRREVLSFSHHAVVAPLEPDEQERWLAVAVESKLSVAKLEHKMWEAKIGGKPTEEEKYWHYLNQLENAARNLPQGLFSVPPWLMTDLEKYLEHYLEHYKEIRFGDRHPNWLDRPRPPDLADLAKAVKEAAAFWTETLEFFRRIQERVDEKKAATVKAEVRQLKTVTTQEEKTHELDEMYA